MKILLNELIQKEEFRVENNLEKRYKLLFDIPITGWVSRRRNPLKHFFNSIIR